MTLVFLCSSVLGKQGEQDRGEVDINWATWSSLPVAPLSCTNLWPPAEVEEESHRGHTVGGHHPENHLERLHYNLFCFVITFILKKKAYSFVQNKQFKICQTKKSSYFCLIYVLVKGLYSSYSSL